MISLGEMVVIGILISGAVVPAIVMWWRYADSLNVRVQSGGNDDQAAAQMFIHVLTKARETLVIHDDGDEREGSIYENDEVVQAVRHRLENCEELEIRCLFNDKADLRLVREIGAKHPDRFTVYYLRGARPVGDVHYKIADGGVIGHLSLHGHRQPERNFKLLDCSVARPSTRKRVFGKYLDQFERDAKAAATT